MKLLLTYVELLTDALFVSGDWES